MTSASLPRPTSDESLLLSFLLAGEESPLPLLRAQLESASVVARMEGPNGVEVEFEVPDAAERVVPARFEISDVEFALEAAEGRGFAAVRVEEGRLERLEIMSVEPVWRPGMRVRDVTYTRLVIPEGARAEAHFEPVAERNLDDLRVAIARTGDPWVRTGHAALDADVVADLSAHPEDSIALPLLVPLIEAHLAVFPDGDDMRAASLARLHADPQLEQSGSIAECARLGELVIADLLAIIDEVAAAEWLGLPDLDLPAPTLIRRWKAWARQEQPAPVVAALAAALLAANRDGGILGGAARLIARELYHHVRLQGIRTWPDAWRAAHTWWATPAPGETVWPLVARSLADRLAEWGDAADEEDEADEVDEADEADEVKEAGREAAGQRDRSATPSDVSAASALSASLDAERARVRHLQTELEATRNAKQKWRSVAKQLEEGSAPFRAEAERWKRTAQALQWQLAEAKGAAEADSADAMEPPPDEGWPADLLAGLSIVLCTGQAKAAVREAMADALRQAGADVTVYEANGKGLPGRFQSGALVVCDVRFMSHASSDRVRTAAERGGAEVLLVSKGQGGIVRAVARWQRGDPPS